MEFFGYIFFSKGFSADSKNINDIMKMDAPANAPSLLDMTNYSPRFSLRYAILTALLRERNRKYNPLKWNEYMTVPWRS